MARRIGSHAETTGPRVRAAATRLIAERGYAAVSMREIAAEVDLQAGALYSYTKDKQSLLLDLMLTHLGARAEAWAGLDRPTDPLARLEVFTAFWLDFTWAHPDPSAILRLERRNLTATNQALVAERVRSERADLEDLLHAGGKDKLFSVPEPQLAAAAVIGLVEAAATSTVDLPQDRQRRITWNMVRRAVGAHGFQ